MAVETDLKAIAKKYQDELTLAKRHAKQLLDLDAEARARVRKQTDEFLKAGEKP